MNVALVCGPECGMETQAIRAALEYFGAESLLIGLAGQMISFPYCQVKTYMPTPT